MTPQILWNQYHQAVRDKNYDLAREILKKIQNFKHYPSNSGGCGSCRRKF
jgi:hypothetical protein